MNREDIKAAPLSAYSKSDADFYSWWYGHMQDDRMQPPLAEVKHSVARYIWDAAAAAEREACAKVCESMRPSEREFDQRFYTACTLNANAIRARGTQ